MQQITQDSKNSPDKREAIHRLLKERQDDASSNSWTDDLEPQSLLGQVQGEITLDELDKVLELKKTGMQRYHARDYLKALGLFEDAIRIVPGDLELLFFEALCLFHLGNLERASTILSQLRELDENNSLPLLPKILTIIWLRQNKFKKAEAYINEIIATRKNDLQFLNMLGYAFERQNKLAEAEKIFEDILIDDKDNSNACNSLAYVFLRQNKSIERAFQLIQTSLKAEPGNPAFLDTLGMLHLKTGDKAQAKEALKTALQRAPQNREILEHLSRLIQP